MLISVSIIKSFRPISLYNNNHISAFLSFRLRCAATFVMLFTPCSCIPQRFYLTIREICFSSLLSNKRPIQAASLTVITLFSPLLNKATYPLPFHFTHLWRRVTLPLSRNCSVVCRASYARFFGLPSYDA